MDNEPSVISYGHPGIQALAYALGYTWKGDNNLEYSPELEQVLAYLEQDLSKVTLAQLGNHMNGECDKTLFAAHHYLAGVVKNFPEFNLSGKPPV